MCLQREDIDSGGTKNVSEVLKTIECRVYRDTLKMHSLYMFSAFMNPKSELEEHAHITILLCIRETCKAKGFRTVQHTDVTVQFR